MKDTAFPIQKQILGSGEDYQEIPAQPGFSKHELAALMIAQGIASRYGTLTHQEQEEHAQIAFEFAAKVLAKFK